jgi:hypothetical protein
VPQNIVIKIHAVTLKIAQMDGPAISVRHQDGALHAAIAHNWRGAHSALALRGQR